MTAERRPKRGKRRYPPWLEELEPRALPSATLYRSADVLRPITDLGTTASTLLVPVAVSIGDLSVTLNLAHPRGGDLDIFLVAPGGGRVELLTDVTFGRANLDTPFRALTLTDRADVSVGDVGLRPAQSYRPEGSLAALNGLDSQGVWTLEVSDDTAEQTGSIVDWTLTIVDRAGESAPNDIAPQPIDPAGVLAGSLATPQDTDSYRVTLSQDGVLKVRVDVAADAPFAARLILQDVDGVELVRSEALPARGLPAALQQTLPRGDYLLLVSSQGPGPTAPAAYTLSTTFAPFALTRDPILTGRYPGAVVVADVNDDDRPDLVVANRDDDAVGVFLATARGDGSFQPARSFDVGFGPTDIKVIDVNDDGLLDVVTSNCDRRVDDTVSVLLGNGDGTFQDRRNFPVGVFPLSLALTDLNGDGRPDVITANRYSADISLLLSVPGGQGEGLFWPEQRLDLDSSPTALVVGDANNDGRDDLLLTTRGDEVVVFLRIPGEESDVQFEPAQLFAVGDNPYSLALGDINGDGLDDIVTVNDMDTLASVLLAVPGGAPDALFEPQRRLFVGFRPLDVLLADLDGDGLLDLAVANQYSDEVSVLLGDLDSPTLFGPQRAFGSAEVPVTVTTGDINGDDRPDLITGNVRSNTLGILVGNGDGTFQSQTRLGLGERTYSAALGDVNGDGRDDIVAPNEFDDDVSVLLGNGDGTFQDQLRFPAGPYPKGVALGDVNGDGRLDVVATNNRASSVSVLLGVPGEGGATLFRAPQSNEVEALPGPVALADVDGDGRLDIVTANDSRSLSVLLGNGDGSFQTQFAFFFEDTPDALALADVNRDGRLDLAIASRESNAVMLLLGVPGGAGANLFQVLPPVAAGLRPTGVLLLDLNGDGALDLVTSNEYANNVTVRLGVTGGRTLFQTSLLRFDVGFNPSTLVGADVNGDGRPDLIAANGESDNVSVLVGVPTGAGVGLFQPQRRFAVGTGPSAALVGDVDGDGRPDLVTANLLSQDATVLLGNGDGSFQQFPRFSVGFRPYAVDLGDVNGDARLDLVTANRFSDDVSVLLGNGDGSFQEQRRFPVGEDSDPTKLALVDVNGDGRLDIFTDSNFNDDVALLLGNGDGTFALAPALPTPRPLTSDRFILDEDINGDGFVDRIQTERDDNSVTVLLGTGDQTFVLATPERRVELRQTPYRVDLDGDGTPDLVQLNGGGQILLRRGLPNTDNQFEPPRIVNDADSLARDLAVFRTPTGPALASTSTRADRVDLFTFRVSMEFIGFARQPLTIPTGRLPQRLVAGDLNGDGLDDLVIANTLGRSLTVASQKSDGTFTTLELANFAITPSEIVLADLDGRAGLDIVVTDQLTGQVHIAYNDAMQPFVRRARFRAGTSLPDIDQLDGLFQVRSTEQPVSVVQGDFNGDGAHDVVVVNRGSSSFTTLLGTPGGGLANPGESLRFATSDGLRVNDQAGQVRAADFTGDGQLDVAILMENRGELWVFRGDGAGAFALLSTMPAGNEPTSFSLTQFNDDNGDQAIDQADFVDVLVGNGFGDVLSILGNGDGTFRPFVRADNRVPFVATDLNGDGRIDVVLAQQANDRAQSRVRQGNSFTPGAFQRDGRNGLIGPGDVALADLDGRFGKDLIFANTGSNNVLVYLRRANGTFVDRPLSFFAGTSPTGLHVAQLNDDNHDDLINSLDFPDLAVANQGSNDVSVLLGNRGRDANRDNVVNGQDLFRLGPRLASGEAGPTVVSSGRINRDDIPDLVSASRAGGTATLLRGVGSGLFNDENATTLTLPDVPVGIDGRFVLLAGGNIVSLGFGRSVASIIASTGRDSAAFDAIDVGLDLPLFFVANTDGSVTALVPDDGGFLAVNQAVDGLDSPSALRILRDSGGFDAYISDARDGGLVVIRFGIDELNLELIDNGSGLALAVTLTTSLAGTNSLLVTNAAVLTDVLLDPGVVLGVEDVLTEPSFVNGAVVGPGERLLAELEEQFDALDNNPPPPPVVTPSTLEQYLFGLDEAMRQLGWKQVPGRALPPAVEPLWNWWHWLERGDDVFKWLLSPPEEESQDAGFFELSSAWAEAAHESAPSVAGPPPAQAGEWPLDLLALVGGLLLAPCRVSATPQAAWRDRQRFPRPDQPGNR